MSSQLTYQGQGRSGGYRWYAPAQDPAEREETRQAAARLLADLGAAPAADTAADKC